MNKMKRIISGMVTILMIMSLTVIISADEGNGDYNIIFLVKDNEHKEVLTEYYENSELVCDVEFVLFDNFNFGSIPQCGALVIPEDMITTENIARIYDSGVYTYIYGDLTIQNYMNYTGLTEFVSKEPVYNNDRVFTGEYADRYFSDEQITTKTYQIICKPVSAYDKGLLCTIEKEDNGNKPESYLRIICNHYLNQMVSTYGTMVDAGYDIQHYYHADSSCINLQWMLYKNMDELVDDYDYYAIETQVWTTSDYNVVDTNVEHNLYYTNDNIIAAGPDSTSKATTVNVDLSRQGGQNGIGLSFSFTLNSEPSINKDTSNYPDSVLWNFEKRVFGQSLNDDIFCCASSWAANTSNNIAAISIHYDSTIAFYVMGNGSNITCNTQTETIRF